MYNVPEVEIIYTLRCSLLICIVCYPPDRMKSISNKDIQLMEVSFVLVCLCSEV